ncbi:redoxin domain-containing protein [Candidatus Collierbacteria bacterium]|nr:redoxin domain-containing protein [Candidatus Collierbacteria bacterium]
MNKGIIIAGLIVLVLVGGGLFIANQQSQNAEQTKMAQEKAAMAEKEAMKAKEGATMMKKDSASRYIEYSKAALDQATVNRRVLYFYANWCPICKSADADFKANSSKIPDDVTVIRVNYNDTDTDQEEKDLAKKYAITYQHTFVQIDGQGKEVAKWNGGQTDELLANIK